MPNVLFTMSLILFLSTFFFTSALAEQTQCLQQAPIKIEVQDTFKTAQKYRRQPCYRWQKVCHGPKRCVRSIIQSGQQGSCYLCSRHASTRGDSTAIGRLVTCDMKWKNWAEQEGWVCGPRTNPTGVNPEGRHCVTWTQNCRYVCVR